MNAFQSFAVGVVVGAVYVQFVLPKMFAKFFPSRKETYLIWSNEHRGWYRPKAAGYTLQISKAGRFTREEAVSRSRVRDQFHGEPPPEIPVPEADAIAACRLTPTETRADPWAT